MKTVIVMPTEATVSKGGLVKFLMERDETTSNEISLVLKIPKYNASFAYIIFCSFRSKNIAKRGKQSKCKWSALMANIANPSKFCGVKSILMKPTSAKNW